MRHQNQVGKLFGKWRIKELAGYHINGPTVWLAEHVETGEIARIAKRQHPRRVPLTYMVPIEWAGAWRSWRAMLARCYVKRKDNYRYYGAIGVKVCDQWRPQYYGGGYAGEMAAFRAFVGVVGMRPSGLTLDRIDPFGDYEPGNVRWADNVIQSNNKRKRYKRAA